MTLQPPKVSMARARATRTVTPGQCLHYVWKWLDGVHSYGLPDANAAFHASKRLHPTSVPPAGVPGYVLGSAHGHVVLMLGGWQCWSTDWPNRGQASEVDVRVLARRWGRRWAGWAEDMAGNPIPGVAYQLEPYPGHQHYQGGPDDAHVGQIQRRLAVAVDCDFGPDTKAAVKRFQHTQGITVDGFVGPTTWSRLRIRA